MESPRPWVSRRIKLRNAEKYMKSVYFWREMRYKYKRGNVACLGCLRPIMLIGRWLHPYLLHYGADLGTLKARLHQCRVRHRRCRGDYGVRHNASPLWRKKGLQIEDPAWARMVSRSHVGGVIMVQGIDVHWLKAFYGDPVIWPYELHFESSGGMLENPERALVRAG